MSSYTERDIQLLRATYYPECTPQEIEFFLKAAAHSGLDPFTRQIYMQKREDRRRGRYSISIATSIDGMRAIAARSPDYAGQLGPQWCGKDGVWHDAWLTKEPPTAARVGILSHRFKEPLWAVARFESYCDPNSRTWREIPEVMIAKAAEALALRRAFPAQLSGVYSDEEISTIPVDEPPPAPPPREEPRNPPPPHNPPGNGEQRPVAGTGGNEPIKWGAVFKRDFEIEPATLGKWLGEKRPDNENDEQLRAAYNALLNGRPITHPITKLVLSRTGLVIVPLPENPLPQTDALREQEREALEEREIGELFNQDPPAGPAPEIELVIEADPEAGLTTTFQLLGKPVRTAGVGALLLAKILTAMAGFDNRYFKGAADQALETKLPGTRSIYHLTEETGRIYLEYLKEGLA